uniref:Putative membrane trafficking and cell signaling protein hrs n=1 Tax=Tabanus bromius TaxID=304241 RepID=A0A0K8TS31_TABBR
MACNACIKRYGFFCKEFGCPNCGYSFCKQCLKKTIEVPRRGNAVMNVCLKCFEKLEKEKSRPAPSAAIVNVAEKVFDIEESVELEAPLQPMNLGEEAKTENDIAENLDSEISKRLKDLKTSDGVKLPSDTEMSSRLADLKGVPYKEYSKADLLSTDTRTEQQKVQDLIAQFLDEKSIDETVEDPIAQIQKRLAALKGEPSTSAKKSSASNLPADSDVEEDEATKIKKIMDKFITESKLPDAGLTEEEKEFTASIPPPSKDLEELPFCTICNEDATVRCKGCDGDLFCAQCFRECHDDDEDFREHQRVPYTKPPNFKEDHF